LAALISRVQPVATTPVIDGRVAEKDPGDRGRGQRRQQCRQHEWQHQRAQQNLEREQRPAERHVVDRRKAGARTGGDQQAPLPDGQVGPHRQATGKRRAGQLRRRLTTERHAHADGDDREQTASDARDELKAPGAMPDCLADLGSSRRGTPENTQPERHDHRRHQQPDHASPARRRFHRGEQRGTVHAVGQALDRAQQLNQPARREPGEDANPDHQTPETDRVGGDDSQAGHVALRR
jgi:hypothetical protein